MLKFKIKEVLEASGKLHPGNWLMKNSGLGEGKSYKLVNSLQKSISLEDLSKLCRILNCTPNDLLYWEQTAQNRLPTDHPCLLNLEKPIKNGDWNSIFRKMSPDKVLELNRLALRELEG